MKRHCDNPDCLKELIKGINCTTAWAKRCVLLDSDKLSPCQMTKNRETAKKARDYQKGKDRKAQYELHKKQKIANNEGMRECLRCDDMFLSKGIYNRICGRCSKGVINL